ncbi:MAG: hypothetical protein AABN34_06205 [Acidobacteriota bacterium]
MSNLLFGVTATDPITFAGIAKVESLLKGANELVAIMAASRISAARGKQSAIATRKSEI